MKFTTPCFISKNTPELRQKLEDLGYKRLSASGSDILTMETANGWYYGCGNLENMAPKYYLDSINCGTNEALFLALAALREDSDYMQWFTNGKDWILWRSEGLLLNYEHPYTSMMDDDVNEHFHKATVIELIKKFQHEEM